MCSQLDLPAGKQKTKQNIQTRVHVFESEQGGRCGAVRQPLCAAGTDTDLDQNKDRLSSTSLLQLSQH